MTEWYETRQGLLNTAWDQMQQRRAARLWALATVDANGQPQVRSVVLRDTDQDGARLAIHTDLLSVKVAQLQHNPRVGLLCWLPDLALQIRLTADVVVRSGPRVADIWDSVPTPSREAYGARPAPATPINDALAYAKPADPAGFAVLDCTVTTCDLTHLGTDHRRCVYTKESEWTGQWVAP